MGVLASILDYCNGVDDVEVPRLYEQAKANYARVEGSLSFNVATCEEKLAVMYDRRAKKALDVAGLDQIVANRELALSHYREATRIYRAANRIDCADRTAQQVVTIEKQLQFIAERAASNRG